MGKISIKVVIAGRNYPLTILEEEEAKVKKAAEAINTSIKKLQENYAVKDMQDLLAMTALQLATRDHSSAPKAAIDQGELNNVLTKLEAISELLNVE